MKVFGYPVLRRRLFVCKNDPFYLNVVDTVAKFDRPTRKFSDSSAEPADRVVIVVVVVVPVVDVDVVVVRSKFVTPRLLQERRRVLKKLRLETRLKRCQPRPFLLDPQSHPNS